MAQAAVALFPSPVEAAGTCQHRTVAKDGQIVCARIERGERAVTPGLCRSCPFKVVNCAHLRFSLRQTSPSPLIVRYNGRTEVWNDDPPQIQFHHAACAARVVPISQPRACASCALRQPVEGPAREIAACGGETRAPRAVARGGKVVAFPVRDPLPATG